MSIRPTDPFALNCRFDRARGEFVVHAGARAGACAALAVLVLAVCATAFVRSCFDALPSMASAAPVILATAAVNEPEPAAAGTATGTGTGTGTAASKPTVTATPQSGRPRSATAVAAPVVVTSTPQRERPSDASGRRPGLNYLVLKSVPSERDALAAREALAAKGVTATIEHKLPGWSGKGWYCLVGTAGFDLDRERPAFDRHVRDLKKLNALKLDPKPYKWRGTEVATVR